MKQLLVIAIFMSSLFCSAQLAMAQEHKDKKEKHEIHVTAKIIEDGVEKSIDTIFYEFKHDGEIMEMLSKKGFKDSIGSKHVFWFSDDDDHHKGKHKTMKSFCFMSDSTLKIDLDSNLKMLHELQFSGLDSMKMENIVIEMLHDGNHKIQHFSGHPKGEKVIIINDSDDVTISDEDGYKIIKIKTSGEDNVWIEKSGDEAHEVEVEVEVNDKDGKIVKKKKIRKKKAEKK